MNTHTKQTIYDIVDSHVYITTNCFQHQLSETLSNVFDVKRLELRELVAGYVPPGSLVISRLKLRTLVKNLDLVSRVLANTKLFIYEQDTWENFLIDSLYFGSYKRICDSLPVITFLNMSHWWSDLVNSCNMPSKFVQVWMLPKYCIEPTAWSKRTHDVVFCGTLYEERRVFIDKLRAKGVNIEIMPAGKDYASYLNLLSISRIAIRSELKNWNIDAGQGQTVINFPNAQWQRDIECAARGCVSMRELDGEASLWGIEKVPSIMPFQTIDDAVTTIRSVLSTDPTIMDDVIRRSVDVVKNARGWLTVPDAIRTMT